MRSSYTPFSKTDDTIRKGEPGHRGGEGGRLLSVPKKIFFLR